MARVLGNEVEHARGTHSDAREFLGHCGFISIHESAPEAHELIDTAGEVAEARDDLRSIQPRDLLIGDAQGADQRVIVGHGREIGGQIACKVQHAPDRIRADAHIGEDDAQVERRGDHAIGTEEPAYLGERIVIGMPEQIGNDGVARRVAPIRARRAALTQVVEDAPGVVDFLRPETVAVVPGLRLGQALFAAEIPSKGRHLVRREPEIAVELTRERRIDYQIIQIGEDRFLGDALHARQTRERKRFSPILEGTGEPTLQEGDNRTVITLVSRRIGSHDRRVVFIDEHDRANAMVTIQHAGQHDEG